ncbi:surfeit locus 1 family protein [Sphingomonas jinjuensis]|uniref:SURF1-like protein n=1 Tax=Sphingomonas jinjuensis TaxID=535907 RepID=A0A840FI17_9SPHN|nr:SURF1 family protein [Sphingomonas jinjuensis]MBB4155337.1 surfeit locus 1 family protein [Sphingomonas jinjuensis]
MKRAGLAVAWIALILALVALGAWQVQRLAWKRALIAQVDGRLAAGPVAAPATAGSDDAYRRVVATGTYRPGADTLVQASTIRGPGWWVLTPLDGTTVGTILVNRGYVAKRAAPPPPAGLTRVTGLLRLTEPKGGFLRSNDPGADRWYSRDVAAIAAKRGLRRTAPYFIDAAETTPGGPIGGLTIVSFPNNHLVYAITWFVLAGMAAAGFVYWLRIARRA